MIHTNSYTGTFYPWVIIQFSVNIKFITFTFNSDYSTTGLLAHIYPGSILNNLMEIPLQQILKC